MSDIIKKISGLLVIVLAFVFIFYLMYLEDEPSYQLCRELGFTMDDQIDDVIYCIEKVNGKVSKYEVYCTNNLRFSAFNEQECWLVDEGGDKE